MKKNLIWVALAALLSLLTFAAPAQAVVWDGSEGKCENVTNPSGTKSTQICADDWWANTTSNHVDVNKVRVTASKPNNVTYVNVTLTLKDSSGVTRWTKVDTVDTLNSTGDLLVGNWYPSVDTTKNSKLIVQYTVRWAGGLTTSDQLTVTYVGGCGTSC